MSSLKIDVDVECPICGSSFEEAPVYCASCETPHHRECWQYNGRCSLYACESVRFVSTCVDGHLTRTLHIDGTASIGTLRGVTGTARPMILDPVSIPTEGLPFMAEDGQVVLDLDFPEELVPSRLRAGSFLILMLLGIDQVFGCPVLGPDIWPVVLAVAAVVALAHWWRTNTNIFYVADRTQRQLLVFYRTPWQRYIRTVASFDYFTKVVILGARTEVLEHRYSANRGNWWISLITKHGHGYRISNIRSVDASLGTALNVPTDLVCDARAIARLLKIPYGGVRSMDWDGLQKRANRLMLDKVSS